MLRDPSRRLKIFRQEASEHVSKIREGLKIIEHHPQSASPLKEMHRSAHTLKGIAGLLEISNIADTALKLERLLVKAQEGKINLAQPYRGEIEELLRTLDSQLQKVEMRIKTIVKAEETTSKSLEPKSLLLVEDDAFMAELMTELLEMNDSFSLDIHTAANLEEARQLIQVKRFSLIMLDLTLPDSVGLATLTGIQEVSAQTPIVLMTGYHEEVVSRFKEEGVCEVLFKGNIDIEQLHATVAEILKK